MRSGWFCAPDTRPLAPPPRAFSSAGRHDRHGEADENSDSHETVYDHREGDVQIAISTRVEMVEPSMIARWPTSDLDATLLALAQTVRAHGGAYTKDKWLHVEVPHDQWANGLPVKLDYEAMTRDVLAGRKLKPANEYKH